MIPRPPDRPEPCAEGGEAASRFPTVEVPGPPEVDGSDSPAGPRRIGKYLVVEPLDAGGQGQVFRVMHPELARELVLKLGRRPIAASPTGGSSPEAPGPSLLREGRLLARCDHPNLVRVVDYGVHQGRPFVVMDYVSGLTLQQYALRRRPGPREAARLVAELAGAVADLHAQGVVHQDIKPRNVLIDERGRPRLIDFGLARWDHAWSSGPDESSGGTVEYMSPEQALGHPDRIGPWTDVFGLGALLYHLLTLGPPYRGASRVSIARQARQADYLPVRRLAPSTPLGLARIVHGAMAAEPERRYRSAAEMEAALGRFLTRRRTASIVAVGLAATAMALAPASGFPRIAHDRPGRPAPGSSATAPIRVRSLRVEAFRGEPPESLGAIGLSARSARVDDEVRVAARLDEPAHGYLIALDPDGAVRLCQPMDPGAPPPRSEEIRIPESMTYALTGRPGVQAFVVVASRAPLPPFERWPGVEGVRRRWGPCDARQSWRWDGRRLEPISAADRGGLKDRPELRAPAPLREVCADLGQSPGIEAVAAIAFPVGPKIP